MPTSRHACRAFGTSPLREPASSALAGRHGRCGVTRSWRRGALCSLLGCLTVVTIGGCARSRGALGVSGAESGASAPRLPQSAAGSDPIDDADDYDPWPSFNERMFSFNHAVLDRYVEAGRRSVGRVFDNLDMPRRLANNVLQGHCRGYIARSRPWATVSSARVSLR